MPSTCLQRLVRSRQTQLQADHLVHSNCPCLQNCDWKVHKAEALLAETLTGKLLVKRAGQPLHEYGLVDARTAKRQRFEGEAEAEEER